MQISEKFANPMLCLWFGQNHDKCTVFVISWKVEVLEMKFSHYHSKRHMALESWEMNKLEKRGFSLSTVSAAHA